MCFLSKERVMLSLESTKTGKRHAASETVSCDDPFAVIAIEQLLHPRAGQRFMNVPCWLHSPQSFRDKFSFYLKNFDLQGQCFRPYSLRGGGATHLFQVTGSMEMALLKRQMGLSPGNQKIPAGWPEFLAKFNFLQQSKGEVVGMAVFSTLSGEYGVVEWTSK